MLVIRYFFTTPVPSACNHCHVMYSPLFLASALSQIARRTTLASDIHLRNMATSDVLYNVRNPRVGLCVYSYLYRTSSVKRVLALCARIDDPATKLNGI